MLFIFFFVNPVPSAKIEDIIDWVAYKQQNLFATILEAGEVQGQGRFGVWESLLPDSYTSSWWKGKEYFWGHFIRY